MYKTLSNIIIETSKQLRPFVICKNQQMVTVWKILTFYLLITISTIQTCTCCKVIKRINEMYRNIFPKHIIMTCYLSIIKNDIWTSRVDQTRWMWMFLFHEKWTTIKLTKKEVSYHVVNDVYSCFWYNESPDVYSMESVRRYASEGTGWWIQTAFRIKFASHHAGRIIPEVSKGDNSWYRGLY